MRAMLSVAFAHGIRHINRALVTALVRGRAVEATTATPRMFTLSHTSPQPKLAIQITVGYNNVCVMVQVLIASILMRVS